MSLFDKRMSKEKRDSLELAEESRQAEWTCPSFASCLFRGKSSWDLISPFPEQPSADKKEGDEFLERLGKFLKENLDPDEVDKTREIPENVLKGLFEMGAFAIKVPKKYGGLGLSQVNYNRAIHLVSSWCGSTAALLSAHQSIGVPQPLLDSGTEEQKERFLPRFRQGAISGFALTEVEAGSDPRMVKTTAVPTEDGKYYILNGEKLWCTNGLVAELLVVMAQTPPKVIGGKERKQITAFIVETNSPGFEVTYRCDFMGLKAIQNGVIKFNNVKVPKENIVLGEGQGLKLAFITLNTGRLTLPAAVTGMSKLCLTVSRAWAKERKQWGAPIGEHEAVSTKLADMAATTFAMDSVMNLVSSMVDAKKCDIRLEAAIAKLFCTEESWRIINDAVQIRGGSGYETAPSLKGRGKLAFPLERALRDSRVNTILEGSSEIMHLFIAREALDFHLKHMQILLDPKVSLIQKIVMAFKMSIAYLFWYPGLWIPKFKIACGSCGCGSSGEPMPKPLRGHVRFIESSSRRLARELFHKMVIYQKKLVTRQNILNRFVDTGVDLFAMSAACSSAASLYRNGEEKKNSIFLADLFCHRAKSRIKKYFKDIRCNPDRLSGKIAKGILQGEYSWLENDIIR